jgi:hypothetical protein
MAIPSKPYPPKDAAEQKRSSIGRIAGRDPSSK